ncbi:T9SS type A sorting domain-containing protein [Riemerella anatipestifer]|uniref:T9SS type A sorting domain-containing protein n=1 Tax=Riemerella anatipestifer TaxID=34085 RepID=UPI0012B3853A|nr:T9SS type A sorting domain-containing protein [Riemerella anatipestifer]MSN89733.1 T9SS C-terminal target domain-containing protein [Riemerella anatipestifer]
MKKFLLTIGVLSSSLLFSQNLITNSSLEQWSSSCYLGNCGYYPKGWKGNAIQSSNTPKEGTYSAELGYGKNIEFELKQGIEAGQKYILSYYVYSAGADRKAVHRFRWQDSGRSALTTNEGDYTHSTTNFGQWEKVEKEFIAPENAAGFYINLNTLGSGSEVIRLDDFKFYKQGSLATQEWSSQKEVQLHTQGKELQVFTTKPVTIKIYGTGGQLYVTKTVSSNDRIALSALPHGVYLVLVETDRGAFSKKIRL